MIARTDYSAGGPLPISPQYTEELLHNLQLRSDIKRGTNVVLGWEDTGKLDATDNNNLFVGPHAGADVDTGSNNVIVGGYRGTPQLNDVAAFTAVDGVRGIRWVGGNPNAIQSVGSGAPTLTDDNTMTMSYESTTNSLRVRVRSAGVTRTVDLGSGGTGGSITGVAYEVDLERGNHNVALGSGRDSAAVDALDNSSATSGNILIGAAAGSALRTGSSNVIIGGHPGLATMSGALALSNGDDSVGLWWGPGNRSPVQSLHNQTLTPTRDWSFVTTYDDTADNLVLSVRKGAANQLRTFTLKNPSLYAAASDITRIDNTLGTVQQKGDTTATDLRQLLGRINGTQTGSAIVVGAVPSAPDNSIVLGRTVPLLAWSGTERSATLALSGATNDTTTPASLSMAALGDPAVAFTVNTTSTRLVAHVLSGGTVRHQALATTDDVNTLTTAVTSAQNAASSAARTTDVTAVANRVTSLENNTGNSTLITTLSSVQSLATAAAKQVDLQAVDQRVTKLEESSPTTTGISLLTDRVKNLEDYTGTTTLVTTLASVKTTADDAKTLATFAATASSVNSISTRVGELEGKTGASTLVTTLDAATGELNGVKSRLGALENNTATTALTTTLNNAKTLAETLASNTGTSTLVTTLQSVQTKANSALQAADLTSITTRVNDLESKSGTSALVTTVTSVTNRLTAVENNTGTTTIVTTLATVKTTADGALATANTATTNLSTLTGRVDNLSNNTGTSTLVTSLGNVTNRVTAVENNTGSSTIVTTLTSVKSRVDALENNTGTTALITKVKETSDRVDALQTASSFRTIKSWTPAYAITMAPLTVDSTWVNMFNFYSPTGSLPASAPDQRLTLGLFPEGSEIEIFNASQYPLTVDPSPVNTVYNSVTYAVAGRLLGIGTRIVAGGAAVVKMITSTSITTPATTAPVFVIIGALST